jgi:uncharacterized membrane protein YiaA
MFICNNLHTVRTVVVGVGVVDLEIVMRTAGLFRKIHFFVCLFVCGEAQ